MAKFQHWCPKGCGKKVTFDLFNQKYYCPTCEKHFTKKQMEKVNYSMR